MRVQSLGQEYPLKEGMATHSSILAWRIHGWRSLVGYSPWGRTESDTTEGTERACTAISKEKYIFVLHSHFWNRAAKNLGSSWEESNKGVFCYVNEVTFGPCLRMGVGCQENQPCD